MILITGQEKCPECNGELEEIDRDIDVLGTIIGQFKSEFCKECSSSYLDEETMKLIEEKTMKLGLFGVEK